MKTSLFRCSTIASACALTVLLASCGGDDIHAGPAAPADPDAAADQRAAALVAQLTNDEKLQLVHGTGLPALDLGGPFPADALNGASYIPGVPRLGIPAVSSADSAGGVNVKNARVTALPAPVALAATWDPALAGTYGTRIALELRALGFAEGLGGGVNLAREPRNGRTFEYMGEDPVLAGTLSAARTQATQAQKVIATIKHFAFNDQETNRMTIDSVVDERTMREAELLAFEIGVKDGQPGNVMCSYNKLNGVYACENPYLLTTVLKNEWGFKGVVQSDWGATHSTVAAVQAGLDEEEPGAADDNNAPLGSFFNTKLRAALQAGSVSAARLNDMVQRKLRTLIRIGVMDAPPKPGGAIDEAAGNADALAIARQSAVLLKNAAASGDAQPVLPLAAGALKSVVVIGGHADAGVLSGGGSGAVPAIDGNAVTTCQQPADTLFGGCATWYKSAPLAAIRAKAPNAAVSYLDGTDANAAASAAAQADVAIVFATQWQTEGLDLASLSLPDAKADPYNQQYDQNALIAAVAAKAKRVIVVLENGSPVLMPWLANVHGVLEAWYPGAQGGQAIADLLFGDANPSGRLPLTFPKQEADLPQPAIDPSRTQTIYAEGLAYGYRWFDAKAIEPLFPFGYGLSYTTYALSALSARADAAGNVTVGVTVTNTGARAGAQTVQIYAALPASLGEPPKRLVGWTKVALQPGEARTVSVAVPAQRFAVWDANAHAWRIAAGSYGLSAAASSRDPQAQSTTVTLAAH
ncbi:TPA: glycoside hydrolase family 3 C-terminal domain-containing protein [Burkholderia cepacia]|uniref:glycoside hydrolase family 3 C-terminal domain-containing protein n=1 Tax=Burkholderia cepacia TaxID=292 RepID=UPI001CF54E92|nr:glycoside hydrolase family 3 C-terminal domain-containing protein [Burkholderia cepacia]MCA8359878.1 glycoside hydrolase family 3 C-terminal domain-containing protein [Burkholderia cepacia]MDN7855150.1 glycoside hydrolase family 3 C-terminal domain-containing protein [Burkholderia cepacia]HDR9758903.1 glycoside hydrolase family 3 protein [Burkholderia cepacia ATCC 25416]HDV6365052.1 glycoside hydrolase family 3 protein [Burkholderia cepacia]